MCKMLLKINKNKATLKVYWRHCGSFNVKFEIKFVKFGVSSGGKSSLIRLNSLDIKSEIWSKLRYEDHSFEKKFRKSDHERKSHGEPF